MKKSLIILLVFSSFSTFSQRAEIQKSAQIHWISIEKAQEYASKYDKNILIFFYRQKCDYCEVMKNQTLQDPEVIQFINQNFYPVSLNGRTKDTIVYNGKKYSNQQPIAHGSSWRHDLFAELYEEVPNNPGYIFPSTIIIGKNKTGDLQNIFVKTNQLTGLQRKIQFLRNLKNSTK